MEIIIKKLEAIEASIVKQKVLHKEFLDIKEASGYLNLSTSALYKMTSRKELPHYVPGGKKIYFKKSELDEWITEGRVESLNQFSEVVDDYLNRNSKSSL